MIQRAAYLLIRFTSQVVASLVFGIRATGRAYVPRTGGALLVSNHQSFLDPVLAALPLPRQVHFMARDTLFRPGSFFKALIEWLNAYPIRRGEADLGAIKETMRRVKNGHLVLAFPEGTRSEDGRVGEFLPGVVLMARKCGAPIVPMAIEGAFRAWPRDNILPFPCRIRIKYGRPFPPEEIRRTPPEKLLPLLQARVEQLHAEIRAQPQ